MNDPYDNPEHDKAFRLVGRFLHHWATLEWAINEGIRRSLHLQTLQGVILTSNLQLRDKIHILRTVISLSRNPAAWREETDKLLSAIADFSKHRNLVAHTSFDPKNGGVDFLAIRAKGKLEVPDTFWSETKFAEMYSKILSFADRLTEKINELPQHQLRLSDLGKGFGLGGLLSPTPQPVNLLTHPPQSLPDSNQPNEQVDPPPPKEGEDQ